MFRKKDTRHIYAGPRHIARAQGLDLISKSAGCPAVEGTSADTVTATSYDASSGYTHYWDEAFVAQIYTSAQMGDAKQIDGFALWQGLQSSTGSNSSTDQRVVMAHCTESEFPSSPLTPDGTTPLNMTVSNILTLSDEQDCFNGTFNFPSGSNQWSNKITFDTNFCYDGTSNVCILIINADGSYNTNYHRFGYSNTADEGEYRMLYQRSDSTAVEDMTGVRIQQSQAIRFYY